jgi:hypothetical protein
MPNTAIITCHFPNSNSWGRKSPLKGRSNIVLPYFLAYCRKQNIGEIINATRYPPPNGRAENSMKYRMEAQSAASGGDGIRL